MNFPSTAPLPVRNVPGICWVDLVPVRHVTSVPTALNGYVATDVVLAGGQEWIRLTLADRTGGNFNEKWELVNGSLTPNATLTGLLAKDEVAKLPGLFSAKKDRYLLVLTTHNGEQLLMGTKEEGCLVVVTTRTVGDDGTPFNGYQLRATLSRFEPVPFYLGTAPNEAEVVPCPTLNQLLVDVEGGDLWSLLSSTQQTDIVAAGLAALDGADIWAALSPTQQAAALAAAGIVTVTLIDNTGPPYTDVIIDPS